jgi:hypothetical protein
VIVVLAWTSAAQAQAACTISWVGGVAAAPTAWFGFDPHGEGTGDDQYNWSQQRFPDASDDVCFPTGSIASTQHVNTSTPDVHSFTISAGATLTISDTQMGAHANSTNAGTLIMDHAASGSDVGLTISDGDANTAEGLTNTGTISFPSGPSNGIRAIVAELFTNQGAVNVNHTDAGIQSSDVGYSSAAVHSNQGTITIAPGKTFRSIDSNFINATGGVITGGGTMNMDQERFEAAGNSQIVAGTDVNITRGIVAGTGASTATGNIDVVGPFAGQGPSTLEGTVPAGITLDVDSATLKVPATTTTVNAGHINLNGSAATIQVLLTGPTDSTSRLTNTGTIEFTAGGTTGLRSIQGNLLNQGTLQVDNAEASFDSNGGNVPPGLTNQGTIAITSGSALRVLSSNLIDGQGSVVSGPGTINMALGRLEISGNGQISGPDVNLSSGVTIAGTAGSTATGNIDVLGGLAGQGPSSLEGTVPAGITIDLDGPAPELRSPAVTTTVNAGRINLNSPGALLNVLPNDPYNSTAKLTNTGTIDYVSGGQILGNLVNAGTLQVDASGQVQAGGGNTPPHLTNTAAGTVNVASGATLILYTGQPSSFDTAGAVSVAGQLQAPSYVQTGGATTLTASGAANTLALIPGGVVQLQGGTLRGTGVVDGDVQNTGGTIAPGTSPGILTFKRNYSQGAGGTLAVDIAGDAAGTGYDQLAVTGTASLAGTLAVNTSGFSPATGQQFKVIDAPPPPTSPTVSGTFATVTPTGGRTYQVAYNPTDVTLTADAPPQVEEPPTTIPPGDTPPDLTPPAVTPPIDAAACKAATAKLDKAKAKLKKLKRHDASHKKIKKAKKKVKKAKDAVAEACA